MVIGGELTKTGTIGYPLPNTIVAIADPEEDKFLEVGKMGEIIINGPQVTRGYWKKDSEAYFTDIAGRKWLRS